MQLGQSPYINIFPEERARDASPDGAMLRPRDHSRGGREICISVADQVLMVSSIASLGRNYVNHAGSDQQPER